MGERCIIVGAGHAGSQAAASLRQEGYEGEVVLIGDEHEVPYHKPPLSKSFLKSPKDGGLVLRPEVAYRDNAIETLFGVPVSAIDANGKTVAFADGRTFSWTDLVLATGARPRLPDLPGVNLDGVVTLRTIGDARRISERLSVARRVVIVGGGFIGMEMAHTCATLGKETTLIEAAPRVLARSVAELVSKHVEARSRAAGINIVKGVQLAAIEGAEGKATAVRTHDGKLYEGDLVVIGVGAVPNLELASAAGLAIDNGIVVDSHMRTSAPNVYAIGDCVSYDHHHAGRRVRLESVQNATDQAKNVARSITGKHVPYREVAWFWSDQGDMKLQTAGLSFDADHHILTGDPAVNAFSVYHFHGSRLIAVDSVNRPADHMIARKLLAAGINPTEEDIVAGPQRLKELVA